MKKKVLIAVMIMIVGIFFCSCGIANDGQSAGDLENAVRNHQFSEDESPIVSLATGGDGELIAVDYAAGDASEITVGYDVYNKGKLVKKDQVELTTMAEKGCSGLIGLYIHADGIKTSVYLAEDESSTASSGPLPWEGAEGMESSILMQDEVKVEKNKKIYIFNHSVSIENDEEFEVVAPDEAMRDKSLLKNSGKSYLYYVIFE